MKVRLSLCCSADVRFQENWDAEFEHYYCRKCEKRCETVEVENPCTYCGWNGEVKKRIGYSVECLGCGKPYLTEHDLIVGATYRGKRSRKITNRFHEGFGQHPDRTIVYMSGSQVQYDSYSVALGRHLPLVDKWTFLKWAKELVSLPEKQS